MATEVVGNREVAVMMCNTTHTAFGPVHKTHRFGDAVAELQEFVDSLDSDPRTVNPEVLVWQFYDWREERR